MVIGTAESNLGLHRSAEGQLEGARGQKTQESHQSLKETGFLTILSDNRGFSLSQEAGTGASRHKPVLAFLLFP